MKIYLSVSVDLETGEAYFTPSAKRMIAAWQEENPLFAADVLQSIEGDVASLYNEAREAMLEKWGELAGKKVE